MSTVQSRYAEVQERITAAAQRAGRPADEITLVAVSKTWPVETLLAAYQAGIRQFGENRPEELAEKAIRLAAELGDDAGIVWHQIGTVQSRKSGLTADHADLFHALDRAKIARRLSNRLVETGRELPVLLEVNVSGESSKAGFDCGRWETDAALRERLQQEIETIGAMPGLSIQGLMTMAPWDVPEPEIRGVFQRTRQLAGWLAEALPQLDFSQLSMGMSDDFEIAIEEGATLVRVGRAIFGDRA